MMKSILLEILLGLQLVISFLLLASVQGITAGIVGGVGKLTAPHHQPNYELIELTLFTPQQQQQPINSTLTERDGSGEEENKSKVAPAASFIGSKGGKLPVTTQVEHYKHIELKIRVKEMEFILDLHINEFLLSANYTERTVSHDGTQEVTPDKADIIASHCYYLGSVRGVQDSVAAVSTCNGIVGFFTVKNVSYYIEPEKEGGEPCLSCPHKVYHATPHQRQQQQSNSFTCGTKSNGTREGNAEKRSKRGAVNLWPQDLDGTTRIVEVYVVNDYYQYLKKKSNEADVQKRAKDIINMASAIYHQENIYLVIAGLETWTTGHRITADLGSSSKLLDDFRAYVIASVKQHHDVACLITGAGEFEAPRNIVGLAFLNRMCSDKSQFFVSDANDAAAFAATVTAHECGHVFGLNHNNEPVGTCPCDPLNASALCVMDVSTDSLTPATKWSPCSKAVLSSADNYKRFPCLLDKPALVFDQASVCGNGLIESGEQCDCGKAPTSECNPQCCSSTTCQLINSAQCAFGRCCDVSTCKLKPRYTECRAPVGECDLSEYCSGVDHICPLDLSKADFTACTASSESSYCYKGACRTRSSQCSLLRGTGGKSSTDLCYTDTNIRGDKYGSCGFAVPGDYTVFKKCDVANALCGQLQCTGGNDQWDSLWLYSGSFSFGVNDCQSAVYLPDPVYGGRGMVPNGATCGTGKACKDQVCTDLTVLTSGRTCSTCSGKGVCNSLDQCHCNVGYGSKDCSQPGEGGSPNSNPIAPLPTTTAYTGSTQSTTSTTRGSTTTATTKTSATSQASTSTQGSNTSTSSVDKTILTIVLPIVGALVLVTFVAAIAIMFTTAAPVAVLPVTGSSLPALARTRVVHRQRPLRYVPDYRVGI